MKDNGTKYFNIQMAAQLSGLTAHTIRAWEKRYNALTPDRSDTGRRQYSLLEVERLGLLSQLTKLGNSIGQIANLDDATLKDIYLKITQSKKGIFEVKLETEESMVDIDALLHQLLYLLKSYKINEVFQHLQDIRDVLSARDLALKILAPLLKEAQEFEKKSILNRAQLHALNSIIKFHSGTIIYSHLQKKVKTQNKIALATLEGDYDISHLILSSLLCCNHQMSFFYLSSSLPAESIVDAVKAVEASVLILSVSQERSEENDYEALIHKIMSHTSDKIKVWMIGYDDKKTTKEYGKKVQYFSRFEDVDFALGELS